MVLAFEEKDRYLIESRGLSIIEFKRCVIKLCDKVLSAIHEFGEIIFSVARSFEELIKNLSDFLRNLFDSAKLISEQVKEAYNYPTYQTMRRYRVVKVFSKCTGIEKRDVWKITRHTRLARSCC